MAINSTAYRETNLLARYSAASRTPRHSCLASTRCSKKCQVKENSRIRMWESSSIRSFKEGSNLAAKWVFLSLWPTQQCRKYAQPRPNTMLVAQSAQTILSELRSLVLVTRSTLKRRKTRVTDKRRSFKRLTTCKAIFQQQSSRPPCQARSTSVEAGVRFKKQL